jgi:hypothetical protein
MVTVSEAQRRALHDGLVKKLGADVADTLMDYLPPTGWSDVARRNDVDALGQTLRLEMQAMESRLGTRLADLRADMNDKFASQTRWFMASQLALVAATIGSITTIAH